MNLLPTNGKYLLDSFYSKIEVINYRMQGAKETLESNFSICRPLEKEDNHTFKVFAAGRIHCSALQSTISLKKRFDLFSLLMDFIWPTYDQLVSICLVYSNTY